MRCLHGRFARAAAVGALGTCLAVTPGAAEDGEEAITPVIPPGREALLLAMLGKGTVLPDGCALADGRIEHTVVRATYTCPLGEVVVQLCHPQQAPEGATETERFALSVDSGSPPESLLDALAAGVVELEDEFVWLPAAEAEPAADDDGSGARLAPGESPW